MTKKDYDLFRELKMYQAVKPLLDHLGNQLAVYDVNQRQKVLDQFRNSLTGVFSHFFREHEFPRVEAESESRRPHARKKATLEKISAQRAQAPVRRTRFRKGTNINSEDDNSDVDPSEDMGPLDETHNNQQDTDVEIDLIPTHWSSRDPSMGRGSRRLQSKEPMQTGTTILVKNLKKLPKSGLVKFATAEGILEQDMAERITINHLVGEICNEAVLRKAVKSWEVSVLKLAEELKRAKKGTR